MPKASGQLARATRGILDFDDLAGLLAVTSSALPKPPPPPAEDAADGEDDAAVAAAEAAAAAVAAMEANKLHELMVALPPQQHEDLWKRILDIAGEYLKAGAPPEVAQTPEAAEQAGETHARVLQATAVLASTFSAAALDASKNRALPGSFAEVLSLLQECLLSIPDGGTQALIAQALEKVCTSPFENREDYYGGCLMYLIGRCVAPKAPSSDITRLFRVRHLLTELDWEHESIESLKLQLMRCVASPNFVRSTHGPDLVAFCFTVHPGFTAEVHGTVKNQVLNCRPAVLKGYSTALFKAWKSAEGGARIQLEQCVQDWAMLAVRTARKSSERMRGMLEEIHRHRHEDRLSDLLCQVYGPVLWRSLKVAHWQVRENAARLLKYTFPLIPNDLGNAEREQELMRQLRLLRETLVDPAEPVRRVGIEAVCITLKNYWDYMPPAEIAELLTVLMNKCAKDKRAPMVRAAVAQGFGWILQNPMSHPTMAAVLPQIADLLSDKSPLVRAAFVELLLVVSKCHGVTVASIAVPEQLLLRLASEHTEGQAERLQKGLASKKTSTGAEAKASPDLVAKQLAQLLAPSLFTQDLVQQVARCHHFMQHAPLALLALLTHIDDIVPVSDRVKLAAALFKYGLHEADKTAGAGNQPKPVMVATMLRVVGVLLEGAAEPVKPKKKRKGAEASVGLPKELEAFVYDHIREEDFLHLLRASHEETGSAAAQLREDLLFALSSLDPARLRRTADLVQHELVLACRGAGGQQQRSLPQLTALMRTAVRWNKMGGAIEVAWERLLAAAVRLGRRQTPTEDFSGALAVIEAAFRDPDVRRAVMRTESAQMKQVIEAFCKAFGAAFSKGLAEAPRSGGAGEVKLLGPGAERWPRALGLVVRHALHLEYRSGPAPSPAPAAEAADGAAAPAAAPVRSQFAGFSVAVLGQLTTVLTGAPAQEVLEALEAGAAAVAGRPSTRKSSKSAPVCGAIVAPTDMDIILRAHERVLEAMHVANHLSVLRPLVSHASAKKDREEGESHESGGAEATEAGSAYLLHVRALESGLWRWASVADALRPRGDTPPRLCEAWSFLGRMLQAIDVHAEVLTIDVIAEVRALFGRVTDEAPADDDLKKVVQALLLRLEYEPQMVELVRCIVEGGSGAAASGVAAGFHARLVRAVEEVLPGCRNLMAKLRPHELAPEAPHSPGHDKRRILASPTPQKLSRTHLDAEAAAGSRRPATGAETESAAESEGHESSGGRSFSARSRSPPPRSSSMSLFHQVFDRASFDRSYIESGVDID